MSGQGLGSNSLNSLGSGSFNSPSSMGLGLSAGGGLFSSGGLSDPGMNLMDTASLLGRTSQPSSLNFASLLDSMAPPRNSIPRKKCVHILGVEFSINYCHLEKAKIIVLKMLKFAVEKTRLVRHKRFLGHYVPFDTISSH